MTQLETRPEQAIAPLPEHLTAQRLLSRAQAVTLAVLASCAVVTAAVWLDPSIVTRSAQLLIDVDTSFTAGYGDTLSWPRGEGPGLGERPVQVVLDIDVGKFEALTVDLLSRRAANH